MIAPDRENAEAAQEVEIAHIIAVKEILALTFLETNVVADGFEYADELLIEMACMHGAALRLALHKHLGNV